MTEPTKPMPEWETRMRQLVAAVHECQRTQYDRDRASALAEIDRLRAELTRAAERLQAALSLGQYKAVGLLEVAAAIEMLIAERDAALAELARLRKVRDASQEYRQQQGKSFKNTAARKLDDALAACERKDGE